MKATGKKTSEKAFTLIELIIVIAVLAIIAAIAVPSLFNFLDKTNIAADQATLTNLNKVTTIYRMQNQITVQDTFNGINSDEERIQALVDDGFFEEAVTTKYKDTQFIWHIESQKWLYSLYMINDNSLSRYLFSSMQLSDFIFNTWGGGGGRTWSINEDGLNVTGTGNNDMLFIGNANSEYTLTTKFTLNEHPGNRGGLGIFFETALNKDDHYRDTGYILQFDRGYGEGEIIIRNRVGGSESSSQGANIITRITAFEDGTGFPNKRDATWWESEKEISLVVKESDTPGIKLVTITLDGERILSDFEIESSIAPENNYTGYRAWNGASASISEMVIE